MVRSIKGRSEVVPMRQYPLHDSFEFSIHKPSATFISTEVLTVFPDAVPYRQCIYVVTTFQPFEFEKSAPLESMIASTAETKEFKDLSRDRFFGFMRRLKETVESCSRENGGNTDSTWVDWTDPATGLPVLGSVGPAIYCDSDALEQLCSIDIEVVAGPGGACRLVQHPKWGVNVYPASGFVSVPSFDVLEQALDTMCALASR